MRIFRKVKRKKVHSFDVVELEEEDKSLKRRGRGEPVTTTASGRSEIR